MGCVIKRAGEMSEALARLAVPADSDKLWRTYPNRDL